MRNTYGGSEWHYQDAPVDMHHALLGKGTLAGTGGIVSSCSAYISPCVIFSVVLTVLGRPS